jgi:beta-lactamase superfamily II metal-dependent hydrolase
VTLLGPGKGECGVVHLGGGEWMIVDSCRPYRQQHPALKYLSDLSVTPRQVRLIVATHWHDDHIRGLDELVRTCSRAKVVVSSALEHDELVTGIGNWPPLQGKKVTSGVEMLQRIVTHIKETDDEDEPYRLVPVGADVTLIDDGPAGAAPGKRVTTLSPSPKQQALAQSAIAQLLHESREGGVATIPRPDRNEAAVVLWVRVGDATVLLAADLERDGHPQLGWKAVLTCATLKGAAEVVKVAHHGAKSGHDPDALPKLVTEAPILLVAPWRGRGRYLPTEEDVDRMRQMAEVVLQTAPSRPTARRRSDGRKRLPRDQTVGRVTVRRTVQAEVGPPTTDQPLSWTAEVVTPAFQHP